jgi:hypothetical protein
MRISGSGLSMHGHRKGKLKYAIGYGLFHLSCWPSLPEQSNKAEKSPFRTSR